MYVTESELRQQVRRPSPGAVVSVPAGARLSPAAADFVAHWKLVVQESAPLPARAAARRGASAPARGEETFARIRLRGRLDSLHAMFLLTQAHAQQAGHAQLAGRLGELVAYCRDVRDAEAAGRPAGELGSEQPEASRASGGGASGERPAAGRCESSGDSAEPAVDSSSPLIQHYLNVLRTQCRETYVDASEAFGAETFGSARPGDGATICRGIAELSDAVLHLQARLAAKEE